jgi:ABC-type arginine transport system permease subunit
MPVTSKPCGAKSGVVVAGVAATAGAGVVFVLVVGVEVGVVVVVVQAAKARASRLLASGRVRLIRKFPQLVD